jgi:hypothetical protein
MTISELRGFQRKLRNGGGFSGIVPLLKQQDESGSSYNLTGNMTISELGGFQRKEGRKEVVDFIHLEIHAGFRGWRI